MRFACPNIKYFTIFTNHSFYIDLFRVIRPMNSQSTLALTIITNSKNTPILIQKQSMSSSSSNIYYSFISKKRCSNRILYFSCLTSIPNFSIRIISPTKNFPFLRQQNRKKFPKLNFLYKIPFRNLNILFLHFPDFISLVPPSPQKKFVIVTYNS